MALALRWILAERYVSSAIVGTTSISHLEANAAAAMAAPLDATMQQRIRDAFTTASRAVQRNAS